MISDEDNYWLCSKPQDCKVCLPIYNLILEIEKLQKELKELWDKMPYGNERT